MDDPLELRGLEVFCYLKFFIVLFSRQSKEESKNNRDDQDSDDSNNSSDHFVFVRTLKKARRGFVFPRGFTSWSDIKVNTVKVIWKMFAITTIRYNGNCVNISIGTNNSDRYNRVANSQFIRIQVKFKSLHILNLNYQAVQDIRCDWF